MGDKTKIQWADATWNPIVGCTKVSEGCRNCYAFDLHNMRHKAKLEGKQLPEQYAKPFSEIQLFPDRLEQPLRWKRPRRIFVNSLSDLFHQDVPFEFIRAVWVIMAMAYQHTFQVLTKRPERAMEFFRWMREQTWGFEGALPNVWMGVTVENQQAADERIPLLLQMPAAVRWISVEPMVGEVDLFKCGAIDGGMAGELDFSAHGNIDWVVCGGESGSKARPMHQDWARSLRDQCQAAGVPFLFKQWGEWAPEESVSYPTKDNVRYGEFHGGGDFVESCACAEGDINGDMRRIGTKAAGRLLDGVLWDQYPEEG